MDTQLQERSIQRRTFIGLVGSATLGGVVPESLIAPRIAQVVKTPEEFSLDPNNAQIAIQAAIDEVQRLGGGIVRLGTQSTTVYTIRAKVVVKPSVTLEGTSISIQIRNESTALYQRVELRDNSAIRTLHITGSAANPAGTNGIEITADPGPNGQSGWSIDNCEIDYQKGNGIIAQIGSKHGHITNCNCHHNGMAGIQVIYNSTFITVAANTCTLNGLNGIDCNGSNCTIRDNACRQNGQDPSTSDRNGILVTSVVSVAANYNLVENNVCENNTRCGIFVGGDSLTGNRLIGNICNSNAESGIMLEALGGQVPTQNNLNLVVIDNRGSANGRWGVYMATGGDSQYCCGNVTFARFKFNDICGADGGYLVNPPADTTNICCGVPCP